MGRRQGCNKPLQKQAYERLKKMLEAGKGRSKREDKMNNDTADKIYSISTFNSYWKHTKYFIKYLKQNHPECKSLKDAKQYVNEWLEYRCSKDLSSWTIHLEAKALGKLYRISPDDDDYFKPPVRRKEEIKRSRLRCEKQDIYFSEEKNWVLVEFCKNTGLRRYGLTHIKDDCLKTRDDINQEIKRIKSSQHSDEKRLQILYDALLFDEQYFIEVKEKGGKTRMAPIFNDCQLVIDKIKQTPPGCRVWGKVNKNADIHSYRAIYARSIYKKHAKNINEIPKFYTDKKGNVHYGRYYKRGDDKGIALDRNAMFLCSKALGHNRITIVADSYL